MSGPERVVEIEPSLSCGSVRSYRFQVPPRSTTSIEKPLRFLGVFLPSTADLTIRYPTTSVPFKHVVDKLEQS